MWESTVRLVGDDEAAHRALTQLKKAIKSRVTETELPEGSLNILREKYFNGWTFKK